MKSLPERMRSAAQTLTEVSLLYGYRHPHEQGWSATELRHEADLIDTTTPPTSDWDNCAGHVYEGGT